MSRMPIVAVVGRPNVGKSTLVNRIVGGRGAVTEAAPGVTRDRREFRADWTGSHFLLVDTGGWELDPTEPLNIEIRRQAEAAVSSADAVLFVTDATTGITDDDEGVVSVLRAAEIPVIVVANKSDTHGVDLTDLWKLGLGEPLPVSAFHGTGVGELLDALVERLGETPTEPVADETPRLAIVGRPNVGKSTLLNRLVGDTRVIVSDRPGTTRDPIDVPVEIDGDDYILVDTAGIRRKPQIREDADFYAVLRARDALERADVALLVVDSVEGLTHQDQRIASEVVEAGAGLVVLLNKWDAIDDDSRLNVETDLGDRFGFVYWAPVVRISALTGSRTGRIGDAVRVALGNRSRRIPTGELNRLVRDWTGAHPPPVRKGRRPRILYATQAGVAPPTFVLFVAGGDLGPDYLRFLEGRLRSKVDLVGTPVKVLARKRERRA